MKKITVGLVQINNSFSNACYVPYSVGLLATFFKKYSTKADEFVFIEPIFRRLPIRMAIEKLRDADIVAFSVYGWNYQISLKIAKELKQLNNNILVIFGGPQIPDRGKQFLFDSPFIDLAIHGEGETIFKQILENYQEKKWKEIPSISYIENGKFINNSKEKRIKDLSIIPSPYLEGYFDDLIKKYPDIEWLGLWETNRGCPFSCAYCDWGSATQQHLFKFDFERLKNEIIWFAENRIEFIFCCDSNFGILKRDVDLVTFVAETKGKYGYPKALSVQNTKNATERSYTVQKKLSGAGLNKGVTLALQTTDKYTLELIGRKNISIKSFEDLQKRFNRDGIETYTDLILALPGETYKTFVNGVNKIIENGQHNRIQFINLSILPNAKMGDPEFQKIHGLQIVTTKIINIHGTLAGSDDGVDEFQDLVIGNNSLSRYEWKKLRVFSWIISFLFFDKILQIPLFLINKLSGYSYDYIIEKFMGADKDEFPIIHEIVEFFYKEAENIQNGGAEFCRSEKWLNIYWPHDEYVFIKLTVENKVNEFYFESEKIIRDIYIREKRQMPGYIQDAIRLNRKLLKKPFKDKNVKVVLEHNVWEYYQGKLKDRECNIKRGHFEYIIDYESEYFNNLDDWFREVVWYGNKKGAYLYNVKSVES